MDDTGIVEITEKKEKLKKLQEVLAEKYEEEAKLEELPKSLKGSKEGLEREKQKYIEINSEYEAEKEKVQALTADLDDAKKAREAGEKGMDEITTHHEYEVLDKQINEAKEKEESIRKELEKEKKILSELKDTLDDEGELIAATEADVNEQEQSLSKEIEDCKSKIEALSVKEQEESVGIEEEILIKFKRIIKRNRNGIVAVRGTVCEGCHMILPAQFANEVHKNKEILFCPYCSRILDYEEDVDNTSTFLAMNEIGSLYSDDDDLHFDDEDETDSSVDDESFDGDDDSQVGDSSMEY